MTIKTVAAVVVTYNRLELLKECVQALLNQKMSINHLIVINNNSSDGTTDYLEQLTDERVIACNLKHNIGGAAGFQYGLKQAYECTNDQYIWFMDDDTIPDECACKALVNAAALLNDDFGFLCSNVRWLDGHSTNTPRVAEKWPDFIDNNLIRVERATFVSVLVTRDGLAKYGLPTAEMVIWGDDTEYTTRLSTEKRSFFVINSHVLHKTENNLSNDSLINIDSSRINRYFYMYRNLVFIDRKYYGRVRQGRRIVNNARVFFNVLFRAKSLKLKRLSAVFRGTISGLFFNPVIVYPKKSDSYDKK